MSIVVECESLISAIKAVSTMTHADTALFCIENDQLCVKATGSDTLLKMVVNGEIEDAKKFVPFTFNCQVVGGLIKGKDKLKMSHPKGQNKVVFETVGKGRKYRGDFLTIPENITVNTDFEFNDAIKFEPKLLSAIEKAISTVKINILHSSENNMAVHVKASKKGFRVACFDAYHSAYYRSEKSPTKSKLELTLAVDIFNWLTDLAKGDVYEISFSGSTINARNDWFAISLPLMQTDSKQSIDIMEKFYNGLPKEPHTSFTIDKAYFLSIIDNLNSIFEQGVSVRLIKGKKDISLQYKTTFGSLESQLEATNIEWDKSVKEYKLDTNLLWDIIQVCPSKTLDIKIVNDSYIYMLLENKNSELLYCCPLL